MISFFLQGLVTKSRFDSLQAFKQPFAHEHTPISDLVTIIKVRLAITYDNLLLIFFFSTRWSYPPLLREFSLSSCRVLYALLANVSMVRTGYSDVVVFNLQTLKPTVMIGTTGKGGQFTPAVLEEVSSYQEVSSLKLFFDKKYIV